ncbi:hypothetical protein [Nonomuraea insulae]|uniref:Luciferase-like monooxygenase n=1 Tax=Nonomuraea insulae TaxID=1616787 RepID=A0ABW1CRP7_9ACTN
MTVKVGVVLPRPQGDPGEWLSEAVAFEAAGADALWVEHGAKPVLDPLTLAAALAAVTYRSMLVVAVVRDCDEHALETVERLSRGRLVLITGPGESTAEGGRWVPVAVPSGRAAWRETLRQAGERGDHGVLVPADPRLLDLLRNPDDPGGRHDLQLAQG